MAGKPDNCLLRRTKKQKEGSQNMQARMTLGATMYGGSMKIEELREIVEECERMGWSAHLEYSTDDQWAVIFTRELAGKKVVE